MTAMDFRQYDNAIGRFVVIDPMAEQAHSLSPYRFGFNNPVLFSDPTGLWEETAGGYTTNDADDIAQFMSAFNRITDKNDNKKKLDIFVVGNGDNGGPVDDSTKEAVMTEEVVKSIWGYSPLRTMKLTSNQSVSEFDKNLGALSAEGFGFNSFIFSSHGGYDEASFKIGNEKITGKNFSKTSSLSKYLTGSSVYILACHTGGGANPDASSKFVQGLANLWGANVYANRSWGIPLNFGGSMHTNAFDAWYTNKYEYNGTRDNAVAFRGQFLIAAPGNKTPTVIKNLRLFSPLYHKNVTSYCE